MATTSIIQYVPDAVTNERINIGVLVLHEGRVKSLFLHNWNRVKQFAGAQRNVQLRLPSLMVDREAGHRPSSRHRLGIYIATLALRAIPHRWMDVVAASPAAVDEEFPVLAPRPKGPVVDSEDRQRARAHCGRPVVAAGRDWAAPQGGLALSLRIWAVAIRAARGNPRKQSPSCAPSASGWGKAPDRGARSVIHPGPPVPSTTLPPWITSAAGITPSPVVGAETLPRSRADRHPAS